MNVTRGGRQLYASLASARQSSANLARIWARPVVEAERMAA